MNMFEMYDFLNAYFMEGEGSGTPDTPTVENLRPQGTVDKLNVSTTSHLQAKPFPWKNILIATGIISLGYLLLKAPLPRNNQLHTFSERRRLARQRNSK